MASRRRARLYALQALYAADVHVRLNSQDIPHQKMQQLEYFWDTQENDGLEWLGGRLAEDDEKAFAHYLFDGVCENYAHINRQIEEVANNWSLERMAVVDLNIIRLAAFELMFCQENIPARVTLNEAIEIAKKYSVKEASRFVNGILDKISAKHRQRT